MTCLYKLSTSKLFEKDRNSRSTESADVPDENGQSESSMMTPPQSPATDAREEDLEPYAVRLLELCVHSRALVVSGNSHVLVYQFSLSEQNVGLVVRRRAATGRGEGWRNRAGVGILGEGQREEGDRTHKGRGIFNKRLGVNPFVGLSWGRSPDDYNRLHSDDTL